MEKPTSPSKRFHFLLSLLCAGVQVAHANIGDFGFGSRSAALGATTAAWDFEGFNAYSNPAALAFPSEKRIHLNWGLMAMEPRLTAIGNVVVENDYTSDTVRSDSVDTAYRTVFGQAIGATFKLFPEFHNLSFGITAFTPVEHLAFTDTGEAFVPEYVLYRARMQRPQIEAGVGADLEGGLFVGAGLHIVYGLTGRGDLFLQTADGKPSTMRMSASIKPKVSPALAVTKIWDRGQGGEAPGSTSLGAVLRFPAQSETVLDLTSSARAFGNLAALDVSFGADSTLFYDPLAVELGMSWKHSPSSRAFLQLDFQRWSQFKSPALSIQDPSEECTPDVPGACDNLLVNPSTSPAFSYQDIFIPKVAEEVDLTDQLTLRFGYGYRPSIFKSLPTGIGNYLDPPRHMINAGIGWKFRGLQMDLHASYHALETQTITKTPGDELGTLANTKIGGPSYEAGGRIFGGGFTLGFEL